MAERQFRFAFVSNLEEIGAALQRMADPATEDVVIRAASMEEAVPVARHALREGFEVVLGSGATGDLLAQTIGQPVVKVGRSDLDLLRTLAAAREHGTHIALTSFREPPAGTELFQQVLGIRIRPIVFETTLELADGIAAAVADKVSCVVGSAVCCDIARRLGCPAVVAMPGAEAIGRALREARALALARRREHREVERLETIFGLIKDGLIVVDAEGQLEFANAAAHELLPHMARAFTAISAEFGLDEVLKSGTARIDHVCRVHGRDLVATILPLRVHGDIDGAVATFDEAARVHRIERRLKEELYNRGFVAKYSLSDVKGSSPAIRRALDDLRSYAATDATLLIEGETGVGKELFAQSVHNLSRRRAKPFVAVNCSALPEALLETELFGYDDGAFTGARRGGKVGLFELAQGGTLFLDEIADVSLAMQAKLLRVLEEKELMRVGGSRVVRVDVRVVSSTYKNLFAEVQGRRFRNDLYFRLATLHIVVPPLRERREDVPVLAREALVRHGRAADAVSPRMLERLAALDWPGNVRELDALMRRYAVLLADVVHDDALLQRLIEEMRQAAAPARAADPLRDNGGAERDHEHSPSLREGVAEYEQNLIAQTLRACRYNKRMAARRLGISLNTLWRKMPRTLEH